MTLTTTTPDTTLNKIFEIIKRKEEHAKEGRAIEKLEAIFATELQAIKSQLHRTTAGDIILISNMTDEHLLNTVKGQLRYHKGKYKSIPKAYMDEVKARPGMLDQLIAYEPVLEQDSDPSEQIDFFADMPF